MVVRREKWGERTVLALSIAVHDEPAVDIFPPTTTI